MAIKKKPVPAKKPAGKTAKATKEAPVKKAAVPVKPKAAPAKLNKEPAKKAVSAPPAAKASKKSEAPKKGKLSPAARSPVARSPVARTEKVKPSSRPLSEDEEIAADLISLDDEDAEEEIVPTRVRKPKVRFEEAAEASSEDALKFVDEDEEVSVDSEDILAAGERVELEDEDAEEDREGPPPWWKDDPAGIEPADDEAGGRAQFDDSDEWSEDDEDWASKRGSFDDVEDSGDEEDSW